ncbi:hypothetical protein ACWGB8_18865 [Kitasatospora sp. NPDC054939]
MRRNPRSRLRLGRLLVGAGVLVLIAGVLAWNLPFAGQWRGDSPPRRLLLEAPPPPGPWARVMERDPGDPGVRGLEARLERAFQRAGGDLGTDGFFQTVIRLESPTWAWIAYRLNSPGRRHNRDGVRPTALAVEGSPEADEQSYLCFTSGPDGEGCVRWFGWLRYGQYLVEIRFNGRLPEAQAREVLRLTVAEIDRLVPR